MSEPLPSAPGHFYLVLGVIFPAAVILIELTTGLCSGMFFDPLPTPGHLLLVAMVPLVNFLLWRAARRDSGEVRWLAYAAGAAAAIGTVYTLLFLPILPFAFIGILLLGFGLLPFAPLFGLICSIRLIGELADRGPRLGWKIAAGALAGFVLLFLIDLPATATYHALNRYRGDTAEQRSAVSLMRTFGDRHMLLRLSYGDADRPAGILSLFASGWADDPFSGNRDGWSRTGDARELYYRVTGKAFNSVERPRDRRADRLRWFSWDEDQGGNSVGGRVEGLSLAGSRIDGSIATADNLAYLEWTLSLDNDSSMQREGRFTMALPEGAVASRATLWVNGEPREAVFAARGEARAAYQSVVRAQRDPLLVTTDGAQRLLVQAFPIPAGGTIKLRIGMTAPFNITPDGERSLALPTIVERNFDQPADLHHSLWFEGDGAFSSDDPALFYDRGMLRGEIKDSRLAARPPRILMPALGGLSVRRGGVPASGKQPPLAVTQTIALTSNARPSTLMIVLDSSAGNRAAGEGLAAALKTIPAGVPVGLAIAADTPVVIEPAPWSPAQRDKLVEAIADTSFRGGQDDRPALAAALALAGSRGVLFWVHGPQPVVFWRSVTRLEQSLERRTDLPRLVRYQAEPGRAFTIQDSAWFATARFISPTGEPDADLSRALADLTSGSPRWTISRTETPGAVQGSSHLVRLWAADRINLQAGARGKPREEALALARRLNLVTPLSGAVVLETDSAYKANGLDVPSADQVPTVPEPETLALIIIVALLALWMLCRQGWTLPRLLAGQRQWGRA